MGFHDRGAAGPLLGCFSPPLIANLLHMVDLLWVDGRDFFVTRPAAFTAQQQLPRLHSLRMNNVAWRTLENLYTLVPATYTSVWPQLLQNDLKKKNCCAN